MSIFLDTADVQQLTGKKRKSDQIRWLRANGIQFHINACNRPVVPKSAVDSSATEPKIEEEWTPEVINK